MNIKRWQISAADCPCMIRTHTQEDLGRHVSSLSLHRTTDSTFRVNKLENAIRERSIVVGFT